MSLFDLQKKLQSLAESFNAEHELLKEAEGISPEVLEITATALTVAGEIFKEASAKIEDEGFKGLNIFNVLDEQALAEIASIAAEFDKSGDEVLQKQANVLDQILMTLAIPQGIVEKRKEAYQAEIDKIKKTKNQENIKESAVDVKAVTKAIKDQVKDYRPLEAPLNTRTCPDHPGAQIQRIEDQVYQCSLDKKIYDYKTGFTTMKGNKIPGTDVARQSDTMNDNINTSISFSTREEVMGRR